MTFSKAEFDFLFNLIFPPNFDHPCPTRVIVFFETFSNEFQKLPDSLNEFLRVIRTSMSTSKLFYWFKLLIRQI